jgi:hypothetical protein
LLLYPDVESVGFELEHTALLMLLEFISPVFMEINKFAFQSVPLQ